MFCQPNGKPYTRTEDWKAWKALLKEAGVRDGRLHDARHTAGSLLVEQGVHIRVVQEIPGHARVPRPRGTRTSPRLRWRTRASAWEKPRGAEDPQGTATQTATSRSNRVSSGSSIRREDPGQRAEDRGFEPRMGVTQTALADRSVPCRRVMCRSALLGSRTSQRLSGEVS